MEAIHRENYMLFCKHMDFGGRGKIFLAILQKVPQNMLSIFLANLRKVPQNMLSVFLAKKCFRWSKYQDLRDFRFFMNKPTT